MAVDMEKYSALRQRLEDEKARLSTEVADLNQAVSDYTASVYLEDRSYGNHMADDATDTYEQERQLALQRNLETVLHDVNTALQRMEDGTYGTCVVCGKEIPLERLEARPYATRCVEDQAREDQAR